MENKFKIKNNAPIKLFLFITGWINQNRVLTSGIAISLLLCSLALKWTSAPLPTGEQSVRHIPITGEPVAPAPPKSDFQIVADKAQSEKSVAIVTAMEQVEQGYGDLVKRRILGYKAEAERRYQQELEKSGEFSPRFDSPANILEAWLEEKSREIERLSSDPSKTQELMGQHSEALAMIVAIIMLEDQSPETSFIPEINININLEDWERSPQPQLSAIALRQLRRSMIAARTAMTEQERNLKLNEQLQPQEGGATVSYE